VAKGPTADLIGSHSLVRAVDFPPPRAVGIAPDMEPPCPASLLRQVDRSTDHELHVRQPRWI